MAGWIGTERGGWRRVLARSMASSRSVVQGQEGVETEAAGADVRGDVEEPVADGLGCGSLERAGEADAPGPAEQVVGGEGELHPAVVVGGAVEREAGEPAGFGVSDDLLGPAPAAVPQIEGGESSPGVSVMNARRRESPGGHPAAIAAPNVVPVGSVAMEGADMAPSMTSTTRTRTGRRIAAVAAAIFAVVSLAMPAPAGAEPRPEHRHQPPQPPQPQPPQPGSGSETPAQGFTGGGQGYLLDDGRFRQIAVPGATGTLPFGNNNRGQIVGFYDDAHGRTHGFLWDRGRFRTIDAPQATGTTPDGLSGSGAYDINDRGQIVGVYVGRDDRLHGYLWDRGRFRTIDAPGATDSNVFGINNRGQMTLQASSPDELSLNFLLDDGEFTRIKVSGAEFTLVHKIDNRGQVVGVYIRDGVQYGFTLNRGRYRTVEFRGADATGLNASNGRGQIVGYYIDGDLADPNAVVHGAVLDRGRLRLFDAPGLSAGQAATSAYDVNDRGQIVGGRLPQAAAAAAAAAS
jgi:probable HAF family extracellular repeat protein